MATNPLTRKLLTVENRKQTAIWDLGTVVTHIWCILDIAPIKVLLVSFGAMVSTWHVTQKWLAIEKI